MPAWSRLPKDVRVQLRLGTIFIFIGMAWIFAILFILKPDQILPTGAMVNGAHDEVRAIAGIPFENWTWKTAAELVWSSAVLIFLDILFVVVRYGGLTLSFLGAFAVFEALSRLKNAQR